MTKQQTSFRSGTCKTLTEFMERMTINGHTAGAITKRLEKVARAGGYPTLSAAIKEIDDGAQDLPSILKTAGAIARKAGYADLPAMLRDVDNKKMKGTTKTDKIVKIKSAVRKSSKITAALESTTTTRIPVLAGQLPLFSTGTPAEAPPVSIQEKDVSGTTPELSGAALVRAKNRYPQFA